MPVIERIAALAPELTAWRRDFHAHPELGIEKHRTAERIAERLESFGIENHRGIGGTGIEFVDLIVNHLTAPGVVSPERLFEFPFTDLTPRGPEALFDAAQLDELIGALAAVRERAVAA